MHDDLKFAKRRMQIYQRLQPRETFPQRTRKDNWRADDGVQTSQ